MMKKNVGIFIFDQVEVLDFAGPFEVFSVTDELNDFSLFNVFTFAENSDPILTVNNLSVNPKYTLDNVPDIDILIIPGGFGVRALLKNRVLLKNLKRHTKKADLIMSVCSGAMVLGSWGLLNNAPYCTHHQVYDDMASIVPSGIPKKELRYVSHDNIYSSGGISAGIDLSFHLVELLHGSQTVKNTASYMEYRLI
jgi:transcriptional regulator GlxA family with amidase domain